MQSANEDDNKHSDETFDASLCKRSHTFCGVKVSNIPSDDTTKYMSSLVKGLQPVTSGTAITPYLGIPEKKLPQ